MTTITLEDGRELAVEKVTPLEAMGIAEGCRHLSGVSQWWRMAMTVGAVRAIDGIPLPLPTCEKHIEGMVARFSRKDMMAISEVAERLPQDSSSPELDFAELTPLETLRIWALIGEFEAVAGWVASAFMAATVRQIGNESVSLPTTKKEMRTLVERLGIDGMAKASAFRVAQRKAEQAAEADKAAAAKN